MSDITNYGTSRIFIKKNKVDNLDDYQLSMKK